MATAIVVAATTGCGLFGPSESFEGEWTASGGKFYVIGLSLRQSGDTVSGVACAAQDGVVLYRNAPVTGDYPSIRVVVSAGSTAPCCAHLAGQTFTAEMEKRGEIVTPDGIRFRRSVDPACPAR
ncbi:MAG: hypothetical protein AB7U83_00480 [Vicinamibacterales bacterium]